MLKSDTRVTSLERDINAYSKLIEELETHFLTPSTNTIIILEASICSPLVRNNTPDVYHHFGLFGSGSGDESSVDYAYNARIIEAGLRAMAQEMRSLRETLKNAL